MRKRKKAVEFLKLVKSRSFWNKVLEQYCINISYETGVEISPRTVEVAEAFGLGLDKKRKFVIYDNLELEINKGDVVYITGDSGSGKSVLLRWLADVLKEETVNIDAVKVDAEKPLIDTVGKTTKEGLELLSRVGLNDAFLFLRSYGQLSDGQKYRYRLARMLEGKKQFWVMDEFAATLDRDTAKIVAFNLQKIARKEGRAVIAATTHTDLFQDLAPSVHVHKRFGKEATVDYYPDNSAKYCSLLHEMYVAEGSYEDWKNVANFHYRSHRVAFRQKIFVLRRGEDVCGAIVYCTPLASCYGRSKVFKPTDMKELNEKLTRITRVVVHPKYRTIGAGVKLVRESLPLCGKPMVESIAVMAKYNPFFERAGMTKVCETVTGKEVHDAVTALREAGV